jgi:hypothetical protein
VPDRITAKVITEADRTEPDRAVVHMGDVVIDAILNEDDSVYVEFYAYSKGKQAVVGDAFIDAYTNPHPHVKITLTDKRAHL